MLVPGSTAHCASHRSLPGETLLFEINVPTVLPVANRPAQIVGETTCATRGNDGSAQSLRHFLIDKSLDIGLAWEHLHAAAGRVNLLGASGSGDEQQNLEDVTTVGHVEDARHPRTNPLKVLGRLNDPDKCEPAGCGGSVGISSNKGANVRNLVGDANTSSPKHDGTVAVKRLATVRAFDQG